MFIDPFDGPRAKVKRARAHLAELAAAEARYRSAQGVEVKLEPLASGETAIVLKASRLPTEDDSTVASDVIVNLRSALDLAVTAACRIENAKDLGGTYFAFALDEDDWDNNVTRCQPKRSRMKAASPALRKVVRGFKPWSNNGNRTLWALSKLAGKDKHQLLVPLAGGAGELTIDGLRVTRKDGNRTRFSGQVPVWNRETGEAVVAVIQEGSEVGIDGPCVLKVTFAFGDVDAVPNQPVIPLLNQMGSMVEDIVEDIARYAKALPT